MDSKILTTLGAGLLTATLYVGTSEYGKSNPNVVFFAGVASSFLTGLGIKAPGRLE
jgi:hypothetical protein